MANRRVTNQNINQLLQDWVQNTTNRVDILYFVTSEIPIANVETNAFGRNLLIRVEAVDNVLSKITFVDILT